MADFLVQGGSGSGGTVTSVGVSTAGSAALTVSGSPVTSSGTITLSLSTQLESVGDLSGTSGIVQFDDVTEEFSVLPPGATVGQALITNGAGVAPSYQTFNLSAGTNTVNTLPVNRGGTGRPSITAYALLAGGTVGTGGCQVVTGTTNGLPLLYQGNAALPSYSQIDLTAAVTGVLPAANGGTGVASPTSNGVMIAKGSSAMVSQALTNGQLLIGSTGNAPSAASLTAGSNITITPGAGSISISSAIGFTRVVTQIFTSSGTYTPTAGMAYCIAEAVAGGGGGGGVAGVASSGGAGGAAGAGSYARSVFTAADIGVSKAVTIGAAGTAGASGANNGGNGGATSLGSLLVTVGGTGGLGVTAVTTLFLRSSSAGGAGGTGALLVSGGQGGIGIANGNTIGSAAAGGNSHYGSGGFNRSTSGAGSAPAGGYGGGGSGGLSLDAANYAGGAGGAGMIMITEFII